MFNGVDRILACDGRTDGRTDKHTSCDGMIRAMHMQLRDKNHDLLQSCKRTKQFRRIAGNILRYTS